MRLEKVYTGKARCHPDYLVGPHRLFIGVVCRVEGLATPVYALFDTASEWCVLPPGIAAHAGIDLAPSSHQLTLSTRFGSVSGRLERISLRFSADEGDILEMEASCFISQDWPGPMVVGWKGCLERIRFALDPGEDAFYFGPL